MANALAITQTFKEVLDEVRASDAYIVCAVQHGKMNSRIQAICIGNAENWEALSHRFSDLQTKVDMLTHLMRELVIISEDEDVGINLSYPGMRRLNSEGVKVQVVVDMDDPNTPMDIFGVFEINSNLKFAI